MGSSEHAQTLDLEVNIFLADTSLREIIVGNVVNAFFSEEVYIDNPRTGAEDFVDPFAVLEDLTSLALVHHDLSLFSDGLFVATYPNDQVGVLEKLLSLF